MLVICESLPNYSNIKYRKLVETGNLRNSQKRSQRSPSLPSVLQKHHLCQETLTNRVIPNHRQCSQWRNSVNRENRTEHVCALVITRKMAARKEKLCVGRKVVRTERWDRPDNDTAHHCFSRISICPSFLMTVPTSESWMNPAPTINDISKIFLHH